MVSPAFAQMLCAVCNIQEMAFDLHFIALMSTDEKLNDWIGLSTHCCHLTLQAYLVRPSIVYGEHRLSNAQVIEEEKMLPERNRQSANGMDEGFAGQHSLGSG